MEANSGLDNPRSADAVYVDTMVESGVLSAAQAVAWGLRPNQIIISVKMS